MVVRSVSSLNDVDLRIKNSRIGVSNWTVDASLPGADHRQIARICDTEIGILEGLRGLTPEQQMAVDLILHRWKDLRALCQRNVAAAPVAPVAPAPRRRSAKRPAAVERPQASPTRRRIAAINRA